MFSVGVVLGRSFEILLKNIAPFLLLSLILSLPSLGYTWFALNHPGTQSAAAVQGIKQLIEVLLNQLIAATIIYGVVQELRGRRVSVPEALRRGVGLVLPVIGVVLLAALIVIIAVIVLIVPVFLVKEWLWVGGPAAFIVAIIIMIRLWVAVPAAVVERPGVVASLRRSSTLTRGRRWAIFGLLLVITILSAVVGFILQKIFVPDNYSFEALKTYLVVAYAAQAVFTAFNGVVVAVSYYYLRLEKEGVDIDKIAEAFDHYRRRQEQMRPYPS